MSNLTIDVLREAVRKIEEELGPAPPRMYWKASPYIEPGEAYRVQFRDLNNQVAYMLVMNPDDAPAFLDAMRREGVNIEELPVRRWDSDADPASS
ncbi:MAG: hypothetical protein ACYSW3_29790 [Planctomycetota bacterium]|jgi:hypothetical protein